MKDMIPGEDKAFVFLSGGICPFDEEDVNSIYLRLAHSLLIGNISPFLLGSNPAANSWQPASVDQIWKMFTISRKWRQYYSVNSQKMDSIRETLIRLWVVLVDQCKMADVHHCALFLRADRSEQSWLIVEFSPVTGQLCLVVSTSSQDLLLRLQGLRGTTSCMFLSYI